MINIEGLVKGDLVTFSNGTTLVVRSVDEVNGSGVVRLEFCGEYGQGYAGSYFVHTGYSRDFGTSIVKRGRVGKEYDYKIVSEPPQQPSVEELKLDTANIQGYLEGRGQIDPKLDTYIECVASFLNSLKDA